MQFSYAVHYTMLLLYMCSQTFVFDWLNIFFRLGCTRKFSNSGHRIKFGLPQLQISWIFVYYTTSAHARHDSIHFEVDSLENHYRRNTVRKDVRSRSGH
jgi:hypothetical protein